MSRDLYAFNAPLNILTPTHCTGNFFHAVNILREVIYHLDHPSTVGSDALIKLFYKTIPVYYQNDGRADFSVLVHEYTSRISENSIGMRNTHWRTRTNRLRFKRSRIGD